jgi:large subunit ribosomal protein L24
MLIDPKDKKPTRVGVTREGGTRNRVARRSGVKFD